MPSQQFRVLVPEERYSLVKFESSNLPGVAVINSALRDFEPKPAFAWHLTLSLTCVELAERGMPTRADYLVLDEYGDVLDGMIKGPALEKPNALFLARVTWNAKRDLVYRVYDPELVDASLQEIIASKTQRRDFEFQMQHDENWKLAQWFIDAVKDA